MATTEEYLNENDTQRLDPIKAEGEAAIADSNAMYDGMVSNTDQHFQGLIDNAQNWANTQTQIQNEQTDFAIEQIEQQKDQAHKDYTKEQSGAYTDWQKQSAQHGVNAEQMAANGLTNTGFSESSQVSMYNTYQNRVATARESYNKAVLNYDNAIKDARLQNNARLAEIAYQALQQQLELSLEGFQYKNNLLLEKSNKQLEISQMYHQRYTDMLNQINTEKSYAENQRQFNENLAENKRQHDETMAENKRQFDATLAQQEKEFLEKIRQFNKSISLEEAKFAHQKIQDEISNAIAERGMSLEEAKHEYQKAQDIITNAIAERGMSLDEAIFEWEKQQANEGGTAIIEKDNGAAGSSAGVGASIAAGMDGAAGTGGAAGTDRSLLNDGSILGLGFGNITLKEVNKLIKQGKVEQYFEDGKLKYRRTDNNFAW
jgi:hypothetical protein